MTKVKITWKAFGDIAEFGKKVTSVEFNVEFPWNTPDEKFCEQIYKATNLQSELADFGASQSTIELWETIKPLLSENRTHTSLSVRDEIKIGDKVYVCADLGFKLLEKAGA